MLNVLTAERLRPDPEQGREWLSRELAHPDYHRQTLLERVRDWVHDVFDRLTTAASGASAVSTFAAIVVAVLVVVLVGYVVPRVRRTPGTVRDARQVLGDRDTTAAELRERAEEALRQDRHEEAVGDAYRALARRMVERGAVQQTVGSTAHELAERLARRYPDHADRLAGAADLFDAVVYGEHPASRADAELVLVLDDDLRSARPVDDAQSSRRALVVPR